MFRAFDETKSQSLSIAEFIAAVDGVLHGDLRTQLRYVFRIFDRDGGGSIARDELAAVVSDALKAEGLTAREAEIAALVETVFAEYDREQDGALSFEEFEAWIGHEVRLAIAASYMRSSAQTQLCAAGCCVPARPGQSVCTLAGWRIMRNTK